MKRVLIEDTKGFMSHEKFRDDPKSFGTFEKQAPSDDDDHDAIYFFSHFSFYRRYPIDNKCDCVGEMFKSCHLEDPKSVCVGRAFRAYFYEFSDRLENKSQNHKPVPGEYGIYDTLSILTISVF